MSLCEDSWYPLSKCLSMYDLTIMHDVTLRMMIMILLFSVGINLLWFLHWRLEKRRLFYRLWIKLFPEEMSEVEKFDEAVALAERLTRHPPPEKKG